MPGLESVWIIGDEFADRSITQHFKHGQQDDSKNYVLHNYEILDFTTTCYSSSLCNPVSRVRSLVAKGFEPPYKQMPKAIVIVLDDDLIRQSNIKKDEYTYDNLVVIVKELLREVNQLIEGFKDGLPNKVKKESFPQVIWVMPPTHKNMSNNKIRMTYTHVFEDLITEAYPLMCALQLKKVWDPQDSGLYLAMERRYTPLGLATYWKAVDATFRFWDKTLSEILIKKIKKGSNINYRGNSQERKQID